MSTPIFFVDFVKLYVLLAFLQIWNALCRIYTMIRVPLSHIEHIVYKDLFNQQITNIKLYDLDTMTSSTPYSVFHLKALWFLLCGKKLSILEVQCDNQTLVECTFYVNGAFYSQIFAYDSYVAHDMFDRLQHYRQQTSFANEGNVMERHSLFIDTKKMIHSMLDTMRSFNAEHILMASLMDVDITEWIRRRQYSFRHSNHLTPQHIARILQIDGYKAFRHKKTNQPVDITVMDSMNLDVATFKDNDSIILISPK
jgi:hypothetical protein